MKIQIRKLVHLLKHYKRESIILGSLTVINSASFLAIPYMIKSSQNIDSDKEDDDTNSKERKLPIGTEKFDELSKKFDSIFSSMKKETKYISFFGASFTFLMCLGYVSRKRIFYARKLADLFAMHMRSKIFGSVFLEKQNKFESSVLVQKSINDVWMISESLANTFFGLIRGSIFGIGGLAAIMYYFPKIAFLTGIFIIAFGYKGKKYNDLIQKASKDQITFLENISSDLGQITNYKKTIFLSNSTDFFGKFFHKDLEMNHEKILKIATLRGKYVMYLETLGISYLLSILLYGNYLVSTNSMLQENMALSLFALYAAIGLRSINFNINELKEKMGILDSLETFFKTDLTGEQNINFDNEAFNVYSQLEEYIIAHQQTLIENTNSIKGPAKDLYDKSQKFLSDQRNPTNVTINNLYIINRGEKNDITGEINIQSLTAKTGSILGIVGKSGIGKTTIFNFLTGFREPSTGAAFFFKTDESKPIRQFYFTQNPEVFDKNFILNILISNLDLVTFVLRSEGYTLEQKATAIFCEIRKVLCMANLWRKASITGLDNSVENLSGGERQRLVFARMFFSNADILYMDESVASLDRVTYQHIVAELEKFKIDRTIFFVSHDRELIDQLCGSDVFEIPDKHV